MQRAAPCLADVLRFDRHAKYAVQVQCAANQLSTCTQAGGPWARAGQHPMGRTSKTEVQTFENLPLRRVVRFSLCTQLTRKERAGACFLAVGAHNGASA